MRDLLHDLLAYTAISGLDEHPHEIDTRRVIEDVLQTLAPAIQETNAIIEIGSLPRLQAQEAYVGQLFQNLISNAIKYRSAAPPRIHIGVDRRGNHWLFSVRDNGIGIDPRYHDRIFGVFKRLHGKDIPGTGIGLAICQRVVERYGGRIWVEAAPGKGSTFFFTWPTSAKREPSHITASEPPEQNGNVGPAATLP
jgi:light-regulated signal transduction histidine kinase (bacteriophytochrome)